MLLIEDGAIVGPVNDLRLDESPAAVLANLDAMTRATTRVPGNGMMRVPAIRTHEFTMASIADAV